MTALMEDDDVALEAGRLLFAGECQFFRGVNSMDQLADATLPEIAFAGRSNVGKSSLVNALTGRNTLARTSGHPGCTQQLNFFNLAERLILVDLPGYGYAQESKTKIEAWTALVNAYLKGRQTLQRACLLVDSRHGLKPVDLSAMKLLDKAAVVYQIILTKVDKLKPPELERVQAETRAALAKHPAAYPEVAYTSSETGAGIAELRASLARLALPKKV